MDIFLRDRTGNIFEREKCVHVNVLFIYADAFKKENRFIHSFEVFESTIEKWENQ